MGSRIIGKRVRESVPAGRAKLRREIRLPISNNYARHSTDFDFPGNSKSGNLKFRETQIPGISKSGKLKIRETI